MVYTLPGAGITNNGLNAKSGKTYNTGNDDTMAIAVFEIRGIISDTLGWDSKGTDSVGRIWLRNFGVDLTYGRGSQLDIDYNFHTEEGRVS